MCKCKKVLSLPCKQTACEKSSLKPLLGKKTRGKK
jgi:hypothetical protein